MSSSVVVIFGAVVLVASVGGVVGPVEPDPETDDPMTGDRNTVAHSTAQSLAMLAMHLNAVATGEGDVVSEVARDVRDLAVRLTDVMLGEAAGGIAVNH